MMELCWSLLILLFQLVVTVLLAISLLVIFNAWRRWYYGLPPRPISPPVRTMIILGSGGHTTEMLTLLRHMDENIYKPRIYILAETDSFSESKARAMEVAQGSPPDSYSFHRVLRIREVGQGWISTLLVRLPLCLVQGIRLVLHHQPHLILCNGPGICVPIVLLASFCRNVGLGLLEAHITYVESICRVRTLSLSGRIVRGFTDYFIVQWPNLVQPNGRERYLGRLS